VTLRTYALAAVAALVHGGNATTDIAPEVRFLRNHLDAVAATPTGWATTLPAYMSQPAPIDVPLVRLAEEIGITEIEVLAVALAAAVEDNVMIGRVLAHVQAPLGGSRPTLGLLATALGAVVLPGERSINTLVSGVAMQSGLCTMLGEGAPLPERAVSVPLHLCLALNGHDGALPGTTLGLGAVPEVPLPPSLLGEVHRQAIGLLAPSPRALIVRTSSPGEGRAVACAIAQALQRRALFIETDRTAGLVPWLCLRHLLPVFCWELGPGERQVVPPLPFYQGPLLALCGPDGSIETAGGGALSWSLPVPSREERQALWQKASLEPSLAAEFARFHRHASGRIAHLGRLVRHRSALCGRARPIREDVVAASWTGEGGGLEALAQPLTEAIPEEALVVAPSLRQELQTLLLRCRARDGLVEGLGASVTARYSPGVRALFLGPSGTGKTLAAGWLATRLGMPLYRVDLASVISKYIGETEKNLAQLLARAEHAEVVLLFDEADSLFGKRTEVREANDRFANTQTNYLLQRIEAFDGITILTSNSRGRFDSAFARRLDMIIEFPLPSAEERRQLWQSHLGQQHGVSPQDLNRLAASADLPGGHIRNVVLAAAVLAREEARPIAYGDIAAGLVSEYRKLGKQVPAELRGGG
jgi:hypothetical protein